MVRDAGGKIHLLMKGADSVVMDRLAKDQSGAITKAQAMIDEVSRACFTISPPVCSGGSAHYGSWCKRDL